MDASVHAYVFTNGHAWINTCESSNVSSWWQKNKQNLWAIPGPVLWSINRWDRTRPEKMNLKNKIKKTLIKNGWLSKTTGSEGRDVQKYMYRRWRWCRQNAEMYCMFQLKGVFMKESESKPCCEEVRTRCISLQLTALLIDTCVKKQVAATSMPHKSYSQSFFLLQSISHKWINGRWKCECKARHLSVSWHSIHYLQEAWHVEIYNVTSSTCIMILADAQLHDWDGVPD